MLREIKHKDLLRNIEDPVLIIKDGEIVTIEDLFAGTRILIDEKTTVTPSGPDLSASTAERIRNTVGEYECMAIIDAMHRNASHTRKEGPDLLHLLHQKASRDEADKYRGC